MDDHRPNDRARFVAVATSRRFVLKGFVGLAGSGVLARHTLRHGRAEDGSTPEAPAEEATSEPSPTASEAPTEESTVEPPVAATETPTSEPTPIPTEAPSPTATATEHATTHHGSRTPTAQPSDQDQVKAAAVQPSATPKLTLSTTSGPTGTVVRATITGFKSNESIALRWYDGSTFRTLMTQSASSSGRLSISFAVPATFGGGHRVRAQGASGSRADSSFSVTRSLVLTPSHGPLRSRITAKLYGFPRNTAVEIRWIVESPDSTVALVFGTGSTSATGRARISFNGPDRAPTGRYRIEAVETSSGAKASSHFTITA